MTRNEFIELLQEHGWQEDRFGHYTKRFGSETRKFFIRPMVAQKKNSCYGVEWSAYYKDIEHYGQGAISVSGPVIYANRYSGRNRAICFTMEI